ncbi:MAG: DUF2281 domain-containing protein [Anaerolineae bacterium]|nr:DUF2281 domain-containing protein [Anaerolineae bacterium]
MVTLQISFENLLDTLDHLPEDQKQIALQRLQSTTKQGIETKLPKKRIAGLGEGTIWMSDDFIDPLPDEFWSGETE